MNIINNEEKAIIDIVRINKQIKKTEIIKRWNLKYFTIKFEWRSRKNLWGRFGGGWNWHLGFQSSGSTLILFILVFMLRFDWNSKKQ